MWMIALSKRVYFSFTAANFWLMSDRATKSHKNALPPYALILSDILKVLPMKNGEGYSANI